MKPLRLSFARQQRLQRLHVGNVGSKNEKRGQHKVPHFAAPNAHRVAFAHVAHRFPVLFFPLSIARTNRKHVGIVGNVGNSTHLHIDGDRLDAVPENVSAGTARVPVLRRSVIGMDTTQAEPRVYSRRQAAAILGVKETTMARWAAQGRGPVYSRSGDRRGRVWYTPADVAQWLDARKTTSRSS